MEYILLEDIQKILRVKGYSLDKYLTAIGQKRPEDLLSSLDEKKEPTSSLPLNHPKQNDTEQTNETQENTAMPENRIQEDKIEPTSLDFAALLTEFKKITTVVEGIGTKITEQDGRFKNLEQQIVSFKK